MTVSSSQILDQLGNNVIDRGWLAIFKGAASFYDVPLEILLGLASRETNLENLKGSQTFDGHAWGPMGLDDRYNSNVERAFPDVQKLVSAGAANFASGRQSIMDNGGKSVTLHDSKGNEVSFIVSSDIDSIALMTLSVAHYNVGLWAVYHWQHGRGADYSTTGGDYSRDVLDRASKFKALLRWLERLSRSIGPGE